MFTCCHPEPEITHRSTCIVPRGYILDESLNNTKCDFCKHRRQPKETRIYTNLEGNWCFFCAALFESEREFTGTDITKEVFGLYCDGGLLKMNKIGGVYAWCGVDSSGKRLISGRGIVLETKLGRPVTNNHTEQIAILKALEAMGQGWSGILYSDSDVALGRVFDRYGTNNLPQIIIDRSIAARRNAGSVKAVLLQGHPTETDLLVGIGERKGLPVSIHNVFVDWQCEAEKKEYFESNPEHKKP